MPAPTRYGAANYRDPDSLESDLARGGIALDVVSNAGSPLNVEIGFRNTESARILSVSGDPARVVRGSRQISSDSADFLGVLFQRSGHTLYGERERQRVVAPGEIIVWHGRRPLDFRMPEPFGKVCLLVPVDRFADLLPNAERYVGAHFKTGTNVAKLLGSCFATLADDVLPNDEDPRAAVELTLEMLGAALSIRKESPATQPRASLFERICVFIEKRLDEADLSPSTIARTHSISVRYLHLLFSERGVTVGGWVRSRRLARCRMELVDFRKNRTITEIAMKWGFSDVAHFSRSFKAAFGISPNAFRRANARRDSCTGVQEHCIPVQ